MSKGEVLIVIYCATVVADDNAYDKKMSERIRNVTRDPGVLSGWLGSSRV